MSRPAMSAESPTFDFVRPRCRQWFLAMMFQKNIALGAVGLWDTSLAPVSSALNIFGWRPTSCHIAPLRSCAITRGRGDVGPAGTTFLPFQVPRPIPHRYLLI
jgi:hypothetical protein